MKFRLPLQRPPVSEPTNTETSSAAEVIRHHAPDTSVSRRSAGTSETSTRNPTTLANPRHAGAVGLTAT
jgi:hypothetical protein